MHHPEDRDDAVAAVGAELSNKAELKAKGHPIPENDIWIAATALAGNLTLVTADSDFEGIDNLKILKI